MFFPSLSKLRKGDHLEQQQITEARDACMGGVPLSDLCALHLHLQDEYPILGFFDASITAAGERGFPAKLAAFIVSVTDIWPREDQIAAYAVYGWHIMAILEASRGTLSQDRYRDQLAGALQHFANGIWPACQCLGPDGYLRLPFRAEPWSCSDAALEAVRCQLRATTLRSEKYAVPGTSKTHADSYRGALEALASASETLLTCNAAACPVGAERNIARLRQQAKSLLIHSDVSLQQKLASGGTIPESHRQQVNRERRIPALAITLPQRPTAASPTEAASATTSVNCANCGDGAPATHRGYICRCLCLCADCSPDGTILECPLCNEFTEFVRA